jgi:hypothetical protein
LDSDEEMFDFRKGYGKSKMNMDEENFYDPLLDDKLDKWTQQKLSKLLFLIHQLSISTRIKSREG